MSSITCSKFWPFDDDFTKPNTRKESEYQTQHEGVKYGASWDDRFCRHSWNVNGKVFKRAYLEEKFIKELIPSGSAPDVLTNEWDELHDAIKLRDSDREKEIWFQAEEYPLRHPLVAHHFDSIRELFRYDSDHPATRRLLANVQNDGFIALLEHKKESNRARPYQFQKFIDDQLQALFAVGHPSYPSGHATQGYLTLALLKLVWKNNIPEGVVEQNLNDEVEAYAYNREIAGVHFSSDTARGKEFASKILSSFFGILAFENDLEDAQAEWP